MPKVLRIPVHDKEASFVLVHIGKSDDGSSRLLDLTLVGTEGDAGYILTLKHSEVSSLKSKNSPCSKERWVIILESILLGKAVEDSHKELLEGVEAVASVNQNKSIDITIRKRIEGITQRLGAFQLLYKKEAEERVDIFEWCGLAVQTSTESVHEIASLNTKLQEQRETINKLNTQLEELITAKAQHETELLSKFRDLLNEKKSKIRDQQRLLSTAKVDPKKLAAVQASRDESRKGPAGPSRSGKRKAPAKNNDLDEEDDSGFEKMDVDVDVDEEQVLNDSEADDVDAQTPDDDETASEDDVDDAPPVKPPARSARKAEASKASTANKAEASKGKAAEERLTTPPRRDLPFAKKNAPPVKAPQPQPQPQGIDDETASEDDEL